MTTLSLRNANNEAVVDVDIWLADGQSANEYVKVKSFVHIKAYTNVLLDNIRRPTEVSDDFRDLSELYDYTWKIWTEGQHPPEMSSEKARMEVYRSIMHILLSIGKKYGLQVVED